MPAPSFESSQTSTNRGIVTNAIVLSHYQVLPLIQTRIEGGTAAEFSTDLGLTQVEVQFGPKGIPLPNGETLTWEQAEIIREAENACFRISEGTLEKIQIFSTETQRHYVLYPTRRAPTFLNSGIPMHRIKDTDPTTDTKSKIAAARPIFGVVLDTCTGLGYTAIEAAQTASQVITVEVDPAVEELARLNPWSRPLFDNPKITRKIGDISELVGSFEARTFARILHDPPAFNIAGELYSAVFYRELHRVLSGSGRLFHYIGDLDSPSGQRVARGAAQRMKQVGFTRVEPRREAFGLLAYK